MSTLVIQRGHVGRTKGATGGPGEQAMARRNAAEIVAIAKDLDGITPVVIDADEPTARYRGDVFVALHGDASGDPKASGASVGYRDDAGRRLGQRWKSLYAAAGWTRGFRGDNYTTNLSRYYGTGKAIAAGNRRAIIVEHGFLTNPDERRLIESPKWVKAAAASVLVAAYPHLDLQRLLGSAQKPPTIDEPDVITSTEPSEGVITVGDTGEDVRQWQIKLAALLPDDPDAHLPDGDFGDRTARWTVRALRKLGLEVADTSRPLVGPKSQEAMDRALAVDVPAWQGKSVRARTELNFYDGPRWTGPVGKMQAGHRFPTIEALLTVGGGKQYRVRNSRDAGPFYLTASSKYVELV
jgi:hypothetical protein